MRSSGDSWMSPSTARSCVSASSGFSGEPDAMTISTSAWAYRLATAVAMSVLRPRRNARVEVVKESVHQLLLSLWVHPEANVPLGQLNSKLGGVFPQLLLGRARHQRHFLHGLFPDPLYMMFGFTANAL